jgi:hypothetical protein
MADKGPFAGIEVYKAEWSKEGYLMLCCRAVASNYFIWLRNKDTIVKTGGTIMDNGTTTPVRTWKLVTSGRPSYQCRLAAQNLPPYYMKLTLEAM